MPGGPHPPARRERARGPRGRQRCGPGGERPAFRRRVVPRRARVPRGSGAPGRAVVPVRRHWRRRVDHYGQRQDDGGAPGHGTPVARRLGVVRHQDRGRGAGSGGPVPMRWRSSANSCELGAWSHRAGTGYDCSSSCLARPSLEPVIVVTWKRSYRAVRLQARRRAGHGGRARSSVWACRRPPQVVVRAGLLGSG